MTVALTKEQDEFVNSMMPHFTKVGKPSHRVFMRRRHGKTMAIAHLLTKLNVGPLDVGYVAGPCQQSFLNQLLCEHHGQNEGTTVRLPNGIVTHFLQDFEKVNMITFVESDTGVEVFAPSLNP